MKSQFLTLIAFAISNLLMAQANPQTFQIEIVLENLPCENDSFERYITLKPLQELEGIKNFSFQSNGCLFTTETILPSGDYMLIVSADGYEERNIPINIKSDATLPYNAGQVLLKEKMNSLSEVTVYGSKREYIKVDSDKTTISVKDNAMLNNGSSYEAVKKLPGIVTSPTGGITLNSKSVAIYIDGAPSTLSGTDLQTYLNSLPANAIEKVELIYNPGASFEAGASGSVINIITSTKRLKGINASFNINYNFNKYQKPSPQILLNGKEKSFSWQTMLGFNYIEGENDVTMEQVFTSFTPVERLSQRNFSVNTYRNVYFRSGANFKLSEKENLLFNYNFNIGNNSTVFDASTVGTDVNFLSNGSSKEKSSNNELSLQYKVKLDTIGSTLDVTSFTNFLDKNPQTRSRGFDSTDYVYNNGEVNFDMTNYYLKYDFYFPFPKYAFSISTGGKYNNLDVSNSGAYNFNSSTASIFDSGDFASAIDFDYSEQNVAFYAEMRKKIGKFNFTAGVRYEDFKVERNSSTITETLSYNNRNFFPNASILYQINDNLNLSTSYSRKIAQPNYYNLDPNNNSGFDQYNTSQGNPLLDPAFFDNFEIKGSAFQFFQLGANYTLATDRNQFVFNAEPGELVSNQTSQQFAQIRTWSAFASIPIPIDYFFKSKEEFEKRKNMMDQMNYIFINLNYVTTKIDDYNLAQSDKGLISYSLQSQFILPWKITNTMSYFILPKGNWEIYKILKPIQSLDISFNRDFLDKKLKIGLHCFDVFNSNETNATITGRNLRSNFRQKEDSRTFRISLTYNFGNLKLENDDTNINVEKASQGGGMLK